MKMIRGTFNLIVVVVAAAVVVSCGPPPGPSTSVQRINPNAQVDLSGEWNDTDANQVAQAMIQKCLSHPWSAKFKTEKGRDPVVRLYPVRNRSSEHINWRFFTKQVEMHLINSGMLKVVSAWDEAQTQRFERADQARHASDKTVKSQGQETGSDFVLNGWIITQNDAVEGQEVRSYITTMELTNSESNEKVWMYVHPIKKVISRAAAEW
jgi:PBP1b-binding outer membrane lipoprotein LpoB